MKKIILIILLNIFLLAGCAQQGGGSNIYYPEVSQIYWDVKNIYTGTILSISGTDSVKPTDGTMQYVDVEIKIAAAYKGEFKAGRVINDKISEHMVGFITEGKHYLFMTDTIDTARFANFNIYEAMELKDDDCLIVYKAEKYSYNPKYPNSGTHYPKLPKSLEEVVGIMEKEKNRTPSPTFPATAMPTTEQ